MNLNALRTFVAIIDYKSFREAAKYLVSTQTNVSMRVRTLEEELGVILFDRQRRPPTLTAAGMAIVKPAREMLLLEKTLSRVAKEAMNKGVLSGHIKLGAIPTTETSILPFALRSLGEKFPEILVYVQSGLSNSLPLQVLSGELDAAIITEIGAVNKNLKSVTIFEEPLVIISPKQPETQLTLSQLSDTPFIRFNRRSGIGQIINRLLIQANIYTKDIMELDSVDAIITMVVNGLGASIVPAYSITNYQAKFIKVTPLNKPSAMRKVSFITRVDDHNAPLCDTLSKTLSDVKHNLGTNNLTLVQ